MTEAFGAGCYKLLTPLEWLMTQVMVLFHKFLTLLGMAPIGISWVLAIVFLVLVVHALYFADLSQADEVDAQDAGPCSPRCSIFRTSTRAKRIRPAKRP